ncbi:MAG: peptide transporter permease [Belnapia sp.]|nr:peptide transporter permease [Belnapia sp.]
MEYLTGAPWILLAPAATIVLTTFLVLVLGIWLRDRLDPTLRQRMPEAGARSGWAVGLPTAIAPLR